MTAQPAPTQQPWVKKLLAMQKHNPFHPGAYRLVVEHDDWCGIFDGGQCNCNPDVTPERLP